MASPKRILLIAALLVGLFTTGWWALLGAHRGWSQNRVPVSQTDEVTGIAYTTYEDRFVPGLEVLGGGLALAGTLLTVAFSLRSNRQLPSQL